METGAQIVVEVVVVVLDGVAAAFAVGVVNAGEGRALLLYLLAHLVADACEPFA